MSAPGFLVLLISAMSCSAAPTLENDRCQKPEPIKGAQIQGEWNDETYPPGKVANFICLPGYTQDGAIKMACVEGNWFHIGKGQCQAITCSYNGETYKVGDVIKYTCDHGKTPVYENGQCFQNGWGPPPLCIEISCKTPPRVLNAKIDGQSKATYASGEKVIYVCNPGYSLERSVTGEARCENTYWLNVPVCRRIGEQCGPPPVVQFGDITSFRKRSYKSGEFVEYKCPEYYILKGSSNVGCMNGAWDKEPVCIEPCTARERDMSKNNIQLKWTVNRKIYATHGDSIEFICINGYEVAAGTNMRAACEEGKLNYPKCFKRGFCSLDQSIMITHNIHYNVSTIVDPGKITFQCNEGMMPENGLEAKCELGKLNYPKCTAAESCNAPEIRNGFLKAKQQTRYDSGSSVEFECNEDYVIKGPMNAKCENGQWTELPVCHSPCTISTADLTKHNIQLLPFEAPIILNITHRHGTLLSVLCKSGYRRPNQAALAIECYDGKFKFSKCFSGNTCRIDQEKLDENNLELDAVHDNEVYYGEGETVRFICKSGFLYRGEPLSATCSNWELKYPICTAHFG